MRIKSLAQGENILILRIEPSTFVSKIDILTTTPIVHRLKQLMSAKYNRSHLNKALIDTEQITQVAYSFQIRPPDRPIVSCKETSTEQISGNVDSISQIIMDKILSFLKDTTDFLCRLNDVTHLVTPVS